ncbi:MAG TPA: diacylglycerol kinase family lipid kinase [Tenuifilaceae bacterium]|nr:diacylglycerol kinase family lipid kinase [Tenuifilaceae bacterium]
MVRKKETVLFVVNPVSGTSEKKHLPDRINKSLDLSRFEPLVLYTSQPGDAHRIAQEHVQQGIKKIIAVGGDGTVNEVASAVMNTSSVLGIVPVGSGNGLARHLRIPMNISRAVSLIKFDRIAMVDYGLINQIPFFCTAGMGFDAHIGNRFSQLHGRGFANYVKTTVSEFFSYKPQHYTIRDNGHVIEKEAFLITVANASQFGNNAYIAPDADISDGLLDVTVISPFPKFLSPSFGLKLFNRKLGRSRYVEMFRIRQLTVERQTADFVHFDGEPSTMDQKLTFKVKHMGLNVIIP